MLLKGLTYEPYAPESPGQVPQAAGEEVAGRLLGRITAEAGDGATVIATLKAGHVAKGKVLGMPGRSHATGTFDLKAPVGVKMLVVSGAKAVMYTAIRGTRKVPLNIGGEFLVDLTLNLAVEGKWDGKKEGAEHVILGKLTMFNYEFDSSEKAPLRFKMTRGGYMYLEGEGTVTDLVSGERYKYP